MPYAKYFSVAKSNIIESKAINRVIYMNDYSVGNLYIFHLSTKEGLDLLRTAKNKGQSGFKNYESHVIHVKQ